MNVDIASILKAIGPGASIVFAAWIFMGFVQQRYDAALDRYRAMTGAYRSSELSETRRGNMRDQIGVAKRRCELMHHATVIGLVSAIFLILTLIMGSIGMIFTGASGLVYASAASMIIGFGLVVIAAFFVLVESSIVRRQLIAELLDVPDLADTAGEDAGSIGQQKPTADIGTRLSNAFFRRRS